MPGSMTMDGQCLVYFHTTHKCKHTDLYPPDYIDAYTFF